MGTMNALATKRYQTYGQGWFSFGYAYEVRDTETNSVVASGLPMSEAISTAMELNSKVSP